MTHDMSTRVYKNLYKGESLNLQKYGTIIIGKNCFIGMRSMILPNVTIGDNSIVAAGAVVTKSIPSGEVWGGVPAKFLMTIEEYYEKCKKSCVICDPSQLRNNKETCLRKIFDVN